LKFIFVSLLILASCGAYESDIPTHITDQPGYGQKFFYLEAPCKINVEGIGQVDIEDEYIAGVISCENPNAPFQALKAQAVQARTFLYYKKFIEGKDTIRNSQADQVFRCNHAPNGPTAEHRRAATETRGQYLSWSNEIIASFYVAGTIPPNPDMNAPFASCRANGGRDPTNTEKWVTYNKGKTNCDVEMTRLGFRTADCEAFPYNRGCASQNGQSCLASVGVDYSEQFAVYYGDDIKLETAEGMCGGVVEPLNMYDQFCTTKSDGSYCFDNSSLITCLENLSERVQTCDEGCANDACQEPVEPTFCTGQADGNYCDQNRSVNCLGESISSSKVCSSRCDDGQCEQQPSSNFCSTKADNSYCDKNELILCENEEISASQTCEFGCQRGVCSSAQDTIDKDEEGESDLITASDGISGGCSSTPNRPSALFILAFGAALFFRRKKRA